MKNKGFTLMELLGSITILALIAVIVFPAILNLLGDSQKEIDSKRKEYAISAAREYVIDKEPANGEISVQTLIDEGYLKESIVTEEMKNDTVTYTKGTPSTYTYNIK